MANQFLSFPIIKRMGLEPVCTTQSRVIKFVLNAIQQIKHLHHPMYNPKEELLLSLFQVALRKLATKGSQHSVSHAPPQPAPGSSSPAGQQPSTSRQVIHLGFNCLEAATGYCRLAFCPFKPLANLICPSVLSSHRLSTSTVINLE